MTLLTDFILLYLVFMNVLAFSMMGADKRKAKKKTAGASLRKRFFSRLF